MNAKSKEWRDSILKGINVLPKRDGVPGRAIVYGEQAVPILTGIEEEDILIAAAEFGKGRIVTITRTSYGDDFLKNDENLTQPLKEFHENLKQWLTSGTFQDNSSIKDAKWWADKEKLKSFKIVVYHGGEVKIRAEDVTEFVRNGGGLLYCLTPWAWLRGNPGRTLSDAPYAALLHEAGICFTDENISEHSTGYSVRDNKAHDAHLRAVIGDAGISFDSTLNQVRLLKRLKYLPESGIAQMKGPMGKVWKICKKELKKSTIPNPKQQLTDKRDIAVLDQWLTCFDLYQPPQVKAPSVDLFPGDFSTKPPLTCHTLEYQSDREDFYSTACYLPAGQTLTVEVLSGNNDKDWRLMIGCHTDNLTELDKLKRWPKLNRKVKLDKPISEITTPFGGPIYLLSPEKPKQSIRVKLDNVVDSPRFMLTEGEKGKETWNNSRQAPGLWADIVGEFISFTLPASSVRELEFDALTSVMKIWDSVVRLYHDLRGTDVTKFRRMWIVTDEQPRFGYMHAGYPIVANIDVADPKGTRFVFDEAALLKGDRWAVFHEIGHNMQKREWTFEGTLEVTVNIFTLYAVDNVCHLKPWIHSWLEGQLDMTKKYLMGGPDFKKWKTSPGVALFVYAQLQHEFGWESYKKVFRRYEAMPDKDKPKNDQEKIDNWYIIFSETVRFNLAPLAFFWSIPLSVEAVDRLGTAFPVGFLPDDEVTSFVPDRVNAVLRKFPGTVRKILPPNSEL